MVKILSAIGLLASMFGGGDEELDKAAAKAAAMENYTYKVTTKIEGAGKGATGDKPTTVQIVKDQPWHITAGDTEAWRSGDTVVTKTDEGWKKLEAPAKPEKGTKPDTRLIALQGLKTLKSAGDMLKEVGKKIKEVKREDSDGGKCFSGELTPDAAKEFGSVNLGKGGGGGGKGPVFEFTGTIKIYVNGSGDVTKVEINTEAKGKIKDRDMDVKKSQTIELSDAGSTKAECPEDAKKALSN